MDINDSSPADTNPADHGGAVPYWTDPIIVAEVVPEADSRAIPDHWKTYPADPPPRKRSVWLPAMLFVATCFSTLTVGGWPYMVESLDLHYGLWQSLARGLWFGAQYSVPVMTILLCHEMGHFIQAWRYGVYASWPIFIPVPIPPIGTFGAVIKMEAGKGDRKAIFDIGISGPLAGLIPTMIFLLIGLSWSQVVKVPPGAETFGDPLIVKLLERVYFGHIPAGFDVDMHPMAFAGWVGLLITSLNLFPVGQLDGGHILYGLLKSKARYVAKLVLLASIVAVILCHYWQWYLMLFLVVILGIRHPPTANDNAPLGVGRYILGILTLAFVILGFTPTPFNLP